MTISNPFSGYKVSWTWADHIAHGYQGGTDYELPGGTAVVAPAAGTVYNMGLVVASDAPRPALQLRLDDGRSIVMLELGDVAATGPVAAGAVIAHASSEKWLHVHALTASGTRVTFESIVTTTSTASTITSPEEDDMYTDADRARDQNTASETHTANVRAAKALEIAVGLSLGKPTPADVSAAVTTVDAQYLALLGRHVDDGSIAYRVAQVLGGWTSADLAADLKGSAEYQQKHPNG